MLISFRVLIFLAAQDLHNSLNSSSGQTIKNCKHAQKLLQSPFNVQLISERNIFLNPQKLQKICVIFIENINENDDEKLKGNINDIGRKHFLLEHTPKLKRD